MTGTVLGAGNTKNRILSLSLKALIVKTTQQDIITTCSLSLKTQNKNSSKETIDNFRFLWKKLLKH